MAETTNISWADATLNFWIGCTEVSNGPKGACANCYARTWGARFGVKWGSREQRRRTVKNLAKAKKLERKAIAQGFPITCFSNSLSDIFDNEVPIEWLRDAFEVMKATPHVIYLLLTKRPQNIEKRVAEAGGLPPNAALLCTVVTQAEADRDLPVLLMAKLRLKPIFVGVSMEPLMEAVDLTRISTMRFRRAELLNALTGELSGMFDDPAGYIPKLDWVIAGGESGTHARPSHPAWFTSLRDQCKAALVAFHFKQWGEWRRWEPRFSADAVVYIAEDGAQRTSPWFRHEPMVRVGKDVSGRLLGGVEHNARPEVRL